MGPFYHHLNGLSYPILLNCTEEEACTLAAARDMLKVLQALAEGGALVDGLLGDHVEILEAQAQARAILKKLPPQRI
jgi:hypothetical protein